MAFEQHTVGETRKHAFENGDLVIAKTADGPRLHVQAVTLTLCDRERTYHGLVDGTDDSWRFQATDTFWVDVDRP